jgi:fucose permease
MFVLQPQWRVFLLPYRFIYSRTWFSIQQIVANPLAIKMGSPDTGAHRLTLAGGINSFGTTIGAILLGIALFGMGNDKKQTFL